MNPLLESAKDIGLSDEEKDWQRAQNDKINAREHPDLVDNGVGSYERFMMSFGSPHRWAGR